MATHGFSPVISGSRWLLLLRCCAAKRTVFGDKPSPIDNSEKESLQPCQSIVMLRSVSSSL